MAYYDHLSLEKKWQQFWEENKIFQTENPVSYPPPDKGESEGVAQNGISYSVTHPNPPLSGRGSKPKKYILDMFPYPS
jgi:leucyl-tRNA synthetase